VKTTMIYTHVLNRGGRGVRSPADLLWSRGSPRTALTRLSSQPNFLEGALPPERQLVSGEGVPDDLVDDDLDD
jgi:hypothetical protein